jgi:hypothetical protein
MVPASNGRRCARLRARAGATEIAMSEIEASGAYRCRGAAAVPPHAGDANA